MDDGMAGSQGKSGANLVLGTILVGLGILFLVAQVPGLSVGRWLWPFFVIVPGLAFFVAMAVGGRAWGWAAIPGSVVTTVGLILLYQNISNQWQSWAYAWALIPMAVGVGLMIHGSWSDLPRLREGGRRVAWIGAILFLTFGAFFELGLRISGFWGLGQVVWPLLLIGAGVYLLMRRSSSL